MHSMAGFLGLAELAPPPRVLPLGPSERAGVESALGSLERT